MRMKEVAIALAMFSMLIAVVMVVGSEAGKKGWTDTVHLSATTADTLDVGSAPAAMWWARAYDDTVTFTLFLDAAETDSLILVLIDDFFWSRRPDGPQIHKVRWAFTGSPTPAEGGTAEFVGFISR